MSRPFRRCVLNRCRQSFNNLLFVFAQFAPGPEPFLATAGASVVVVHS